MGLLSQSSFPHVGQEIPLGCGSFAFLFCKSYASAALRSCSSRDISMISPDVPRGTLPAGGLGNPDSGECSLIFLSAASQPSIHLRKCGFMVYGGNLRPPSALAFHPSSYTSTPGSGLNTGLFIVSEILCIRKRGISGSGSFLAPFRVYGFHCVLNPGCRVVGVG